MITLKKGYTLLFFIGMFFFSFNSFSGIAAFGEFKNEAGAFFFMGGFILMLIDGKIYLPFKNRGFQILLLFIIWCFVCTLLNLPSILDYWFKRTSGINRFIRQYFSLLLSSIIFFSLYWNVIRQMTLEEVLLKVRKVFFLSLIIASVYGFFETLFVVFHIGAVRPILKLFNYFPFMDVTLGNERIRSIAFEPPWLAIYLITIAGWMFSYIITEKSIYRFVPACAVLVLTFFSGSRTGLVVVLVQFAILLYFLYKSSNYRRIIHRGFAILAAFAILLLVINGEKVIMSVTKKADSLNFADNLTKNVSNKSRFGIQYSSMVVFFENPVSGVGFGQQAFEGHFHYPGWSKRNNWEFELIYLNSKDPSFPPGYNMYTRLLAETGLIGIIIYLALLCYCVKNSLLLLKSNNETIHILGLILLISFTGLILNGFQGDTFRLYGFWFCLALLIKMIPYQDNSIKRSIDLY